MQNDPESIQNHLPKFSIFSLTEEEIDARQREWEKEREDSEAKKNAIKAKQILDASGLPEKHMAAIEPMGEAWIKLETRLKAKIGSGFLIALCGGRGTGKTRLAASCAQQAAYQKRSVTYKTTMDFFLDIKASFHQTGKTERDVIAEYAKPSLLILDETQERGETPWEDRLLTHLIDRRYGAEKDTLLISNQTKPAFLESMGESITSRIEETGGVAECNWPSYRKK